MGKSGTIAVGKEADLILLSGKPLRDLRYTAEPAGVMIQGRWHSKAELDQITQLLPDGAMALKAVRAGKAAP